MIIRRVLNNNVVDALDDSLQEVIVFGKGLGFRSKPGERVDQSLVEKVFRLEDDAASRHFASIVDSIPAEILTATADLVARARAELSAKISDSLYASLADHFVFAVQRARDGGDFTVPLAVEVRRYYPSEYAFAKSAVTELNSRLDVDLPEEEATSIALHVINAQVGGAADSAARLMELTHSILDIVRLHFGLHYDDANSSYLRFVTHVRFFAQRVLLGETVQRDDAELLRILTEQKPAAFSSVDKVDAFVKRSHGHAMSASEKVYLGLHIANFL
ncbi:MULTISPECIES: PRD domain-containing protein [unclassified Pseudoclavibacter]|uniref:PRD domain-containing protein n=1 Tax=unclassified Pseudoclavibacter TaxID=2615177 RepID=UPI000CE7B436|nr:MULTISPECIES: PRD domain-containing protein [unclassified Pseudoclavibacter]PPF72309.1 transcription antiterminator LicT [Pseudoclavibacter sp. Z016]PPG00867.1 transcription antiterminator LicT [Pseudoclavibacter sp. RFBI5]